MSGRHIGEDILSFTPRHAWGPDKGSKVCPICKYGRYHGILYFVGNNPDWEAIKKWLLFLEKESIQREKHLKVYFVYGNQRAYDAAFRMQELESLGQELDLKYTALTFVPSFIDQDSDIYLNEINPAQKNTFLMYRQSTIVDKYTDLEPTLANFQLISNSLDRTSGAFFHLDRMKKE